MCKSCGWWDISMGVVCRMIVGEATTYYMDRLTCFTLALNHI